MAARRPDCLLRERGAHSPDGRSRVCKAISEIRKRAQRAGRAVDARTRKRRDNGDGIGRDRLLAGGQRLDDSARGAIAAQRRRGDRRDRRFIGAAYRQRRRGPPLRPAARPHDTSDIRRTDAAAERDYGPGDTVFTTVGNFASGHALGAFTGPVRDGNRRLFVHTPRLQRPFRARRVARCGAIARRDERARPHYRSVDGVERRGVGRGAAAARNENGT